MREYWEDDRRVLFMGCRKMMELNPWELDRDNTIPAKNVIGSRRYPFRWTGDIGRTYRELEWQIQAITDTDGAMKAVSHLVADTFAKDANLYARWNQFVDLLPVSRSHAMKPWEFGADTEAAIRRTRELLYRLLPYIHSTAYESYATGVPMTRPMLLAFPDDQRCGRDQWPLQYMLGDSLLVAPVYADLRAMEIYLPEGSHWIDYRSNQAYEGGQIIDYDTSDVGVIPMFVRAGAILPQRDDALWDRFFRDHRSPHSRRYPSGTSELTLYEDDGVSTRYQSGAFATTHIESREQGAITVTVGASNGAYAGKPDARDYVVRVLDVDRPASLTRDGAVQPFSYDPDSRSVSLRFHADTSSESVVTVEFRGPP